MAVTVAIEMGDISIVLDETNHSSNGGDESQLTNSPSLPMQIQDRDNKTEGTSLVENGGPKNSAIQSFSFTNTQLRFIKVISLLLIGGCALLGMVFSKLTFVSITARMYTLYSNSKVNETMSNDQKSTTSTVIVFQLVSILVIPEVVGLAHCLMLGCIGKSSTTYPWPCWKTLLLVRRYSIYSYTYIHSYVAKV